MTNHIGKPGTGTTWVRRLALFSAAAAVAVATSTGCVMNTRGPEFKRYSREVPFPVKPTLYRAHDLELQVLSGYATEVYTALGTEGSTVHLQVKLANRGSRPITVGMKTMAAFVPEISYKVRVYFRDDVVLQPGGQAQVEIDILAGVPPRSRPLALLYTYSPEYQGVRMELEYY